MASSDRVRCDLTTFASVVVTKMGSGEAVLQVKNLSRCALYYKGPTPYLRSLGPEGLLEIL